MKPPQMRLGGQGIGFPWLLDDAHSNQTDEEQGRSSIEYATTDEQEGSSFVHWNGQLLQVAMAATCSHPSSARRMYRYQTFLLGQHQGKSFQSNESIDHTQVYQ